MTEENISHEGLRYIAGHIANRTKNKYNLGAHTFRMKPEDDNIMQSWIMCLSRGGLTEPDENFLKCCYTMKSTFQTYHGQNDLCHSNGINKDLVDIIRVKVDLLVEVVKIFVETRTFIHLNFVNAALNYNACSNERKARRETLQIVK
jgi:hypothetical protein